jgi:hypothetical protein
MKLMIAGLFLVLSTQIKAEVSEIKIKDVKHIVQSLNPDSTCMDEYLKRRKQLIIGLTLTPVTAIAGSVTSAYAGAVTGAVVAGTVGNVDALAAFVGGGTIGFFAGAGAVGVGTVASALTLANNILITKTLAEEYKGESDHYANKLHHKYLKHSKVDLSKDDFMKKLMAYDSAGLLCNGKMVKQPRIRLGPKLKFKVAKLKDLVRYMDSH